MRLFAILTTAVLLTVAAPQTARAAAPAACQHATSIVLFADAALRERGGLTRFAKRRFGADLLHLLIHYGSLSAPQVRERIMALDADRARRMDELAIAWGFEAGTAEDRAWVAGQTTLDPMLGYSAWRALLQIDDGKTVFDILKAREKPLEPNSVLGSALMVGHIAAGWPIDRKLVLAEYAAAAGYPVYGAAVLFTDPDQSEYSQFASQHSDDPQIIAMTPEMMFGSLLTVPNDIGPLPTGTDRDAFRKRMYPVLQLSYRMGVFDFMPIVLNQTGKEAEVSGAGQRVLARVENGEVDPARDPDAGWILAYQALVAELGRDAADETLSSFDLPGGRHYRGLARDFLDWVIAARAVRDHFRSGDAGAPARPADLQSKFDWPAWVAATAAVRSGAFPPVDASSVEAVRIAVEVLFAADKHAEILALVLAAKLAADDSVPILRDFAMRLDRRCAMVSVAPGQAIILGGATVFRFDR